MKNNTANLEAIRKVASALDELNKQVIYVGGATVGLYINDPAADEVRPTKDVDISLSLATLGELEHMRESLVQKGFRQTSEDSVICRFRYDDVIVDVMNTKALGWAPANPWFAAGFDNRIKIEINGQHIQLMPFPYFIASKLTAYSSRGNNDPRTSHDFEDVVYVFDNRTDLIDQVSQSPDDVSGYLLNEINEMLRDNLKKEAILGHLSPSGREERYNMLMDKLTTIAGNKKHRP